jgi:tetratricopeptide (TPR) repeat protein
VTTSLATTAAAASAAVKTTGAAARIVPISENCLNLCIYKLEWDDQSGIATQTYTAHQMRSVVKNTGQQVSVRLRQRTAFQAGGTYAVVAGEFHASCLGTNRSSATLFYFDSKRARHDPNVQCSWFENAPILGPTGGTSYPCERKKGFEGDIEAAGIALVQTVQDSIAWESRIAEGDDHLRKSRLEPAMQCFANAEEVASTAAEQAQARLRVAGIMRRFGKYKEAVTYFDALAADATALSADERIDALGELGVIHRHLGQLDSAEEVLREQCDLAKQIQEKRGLCRALGNLGMVAIQRGNNEVAIPLLEQRVQLARELKHSLWEAIGLSRLSIAQFNAGNFEAALRQSKEALAVAEKGSDSKAIALGRLFVARPLIKLGRFVEATEQLDTHCGPKRCTVAMALCEEPSDEHAEYLREIAAAGCNLRLEDIDGYNCLDFAHFAGDSGLKTLEILEQSFPSETHMQVKTFEQLMVVAEEKRCYCVLLQEHLRNPLQTGHPANTRNAYHGALSKDPSLSKTLDWLKYLTFDDFMKADCIPRSDKAPIVTYDPTTAPCGLMLVFISYRWLNPGSEPADPDDSKKSQYHRVLDAVRRWMSCEKIQPENVGIWMDFFCIDQDNRAVMARGVNGLPAILCQVDSVISLVDSSYYSRAWCCIEVQFVQAIRNSHALVEWYEDTTSPPPERLVRAASRKVNPRRANLSYESDRPKIQFLQLQANILSDIGRESISIAEEVFNELQAAMTTQAVMLQPVVYITLGGQGSGKELVMAKEVVGQATLDMLVQPSLGTIMALRPHLQDGSLCTDHGVTDHRSSPWSHLRRIAAQVLDRTIAKQQPFWLKKTPRRAQEAVDLAKICLYSGYEVHVIYVRCEPIVGWQRVWQRDKRKPGGVQNKEAWVFGSYDCADSSSCVDRADQAWKFVSLALEGLGVTLRSIDNSANIADMQ